MLKKWTCILFIFTANILLLAHSIIPHHHHNGIPHFEWLASHSEDECHNCCHHENGETCLFEQNIDAVCETKEDCACILCDSHDYHQGMLLQAVLLTYTYDFSSVRENFSLKEPPYLISYHFDYAGSGLGLRAPPMERG
jgi:hypothetical protein